MINATVRYFEGGILQTKPMQFACLPAVGHWIVTDGNWDRRRPVESVIWDRNGQPVLGLGKPCYE